MDLFYRMEWPCHSVIFNKYIIEAKVSEKQLPDFTQDYKYYKKSDVGRSLIVVAQDQLLYIVSYNL